MKVKDTLEQEYLALLERHKRLIFKVANVYCRNHDDRQDLVQEITLQLWRAFPTYDKIRTSSTWIYRIALNVAISFLRKEKSRTRTFDSYKQNVELLTWEDDVIDQRLKQLYAAMDHLAPFDKAILVLHFERVSNDNIAEIMGISSSNVSTKLYRVKNKLNQKINSLK